MIDLFVLIVFCFFLANIIDIQSMKYESVMIAKKNRLSIRFKYFILLSALILFSGLRTSYNDTSAYMQTYSLLQYDSIQLSTILEPYGGFLLFEQLLKEYISIDPQSLVFISSMIVNSILFGFMQNIAGILL